MSGFSVEDLAAVVSERMAADPETSYTARLAARGIEKCAQKFGEEAVEAVIAAAAGDRAGLRAEAADVVYHLLVLLAVSGVSLAEVTEELSRRTARSGLAEKAARGPS